MKYNEKINLRGILIAIAIVSATVSTILVWILVLLKKLIAEMYVHRALLNLGMKVFLRFHLFRIAASPGEPFNEIIYIAR